MEIDRRNFLKLTSKSLIILASANVLHGCSPLVRSNKFKNSSMQLLAKLLNKEQINILNLASLAPSGHNSQPWTVRIKEQNSWIIGTTPDRWLPAVDPNNRELLLSIGAFIENLIVASQYYGYEIEYKVIAKKSSKYT